MEPFINTVKSAGVKEQGNTLKGKRTQKVHTLKRNFLKNLGSMKGVLVVIANGRIFLIPREMLGTRLLKITSFHY